MDPAAANAPAPPGSGSGFPGPEGAPSGGPALGATAGLVVRFGDFGLDEANARLVRLGGAPVELQPKAFAVLCALVRRGGQLVTKDALLDEVWGHRHVSESVLKTLVSHLRQALADDARQPRYIETASRRGYRFVAAVEAAGGVAAPVAAAGAALVVPPPALMPALPATAMPPLIGRRAPVQQLAAAWALACQRQRQLVLVAGDAGVGKSTLIEGWVAALGVAALQIARGQCLEHYGSAEPYMPLLEALNLLCRGDGGDAVLAQMRRVAPTWLAQLPWFLSDDDRRQLPREVAGATQPRMLREAGELLDRITERRPLLLVLEDLHWSDHATVQLVGYLARRRTPAALMLLATFRPTDVIVEEHPLAGLRQELKLHRLCSEIDLEAFSEADVGELVAARLQGERAPEAFVRALQAHTDGLPLFVVNVLDELIAAGTLARAADGGWHYPEAAAFGVPRQIAGVVEKQVARLAAEQQRLLAAASVVGGEFDHLVVAALLGRPAADVRAALDAHAAQGPWLRAGAVAPLADGRLAARYAFRHVLYRHALYGALAPAQRSQWHREAASALLEAQGGHPDEMAAELAMHFERGGEAELAAAMLAIVSRRALGRSAAREALRAARQGLALAAAAAPGTVPPAAELELAVLEALSLSRLHVISEAPVAAAFERAHALSTRAGDSPARAQAQHGLWWVRFVRCELDAARALAEGMVALAEARDDPGLLIAGSSALGITQAMRGELVAAAQHLRDAIELHAAADERLPPATFVQDPGVEARAYLALVVWCTGEPALARRLSAEAVARAEAIRHPVSQIVALNLAAALHALAGESAVALECTERIEQVIRSHELPTARGAFSWVRGHMRVLQGEGDAGLAEIDEAERSCTALGMRIGLTGCHRHRAEACHALGLTADALAAAERGIALALETGEHFQLAMLHRLRGELQRDSGDAAAAREDFARALATAREQGAPFHELTVQLAAGRIEGGPGQEADAGLRRAIAAYRDEAVGARARERWPEG